MEIIIREIWEKETVGFFSILSLLSGCLEKNRSSERNIPR
jgi:hypothetical protein